MGNLTNFTVLYLYNGYNGYNRLQKNISFHISSLNTPSAYRVTIHPLNMPILTAQCKVKVFALTLAKNSTASTEGQKGKGFMLEP